MASLLGPGQGTHLILVQTKQRWHLLPSLRWKDLQRADAPFTVTDTLFQESNATVGEAGTWGSLTEGKGCSENWEGCGRVLWGPAFQSSIKDRCLGTLAELGAELGAELTLSSWVVGGCVQDRNGEESFHREAAGKPEKWGRGSSEKTQETLGNTAF